MNLIQVNIIQLPPDSWQRYRDFRLQAIKSDPLAFGMSYEDEVNLSEVEWHSRIKNMWFAVIDEQIVGMIGFVRAQGQPSKHNAWVISFWVAPQFRGQGIGKQLLLYIQEYALTNGIRKVSLQVTTTQEAAIALYERLGFKKITLLKEEVKHGDQYYDHYLMEWYAEHA